jgi:hypothetical protein
MFEKAKQRPDVETLKPVYAMLNGACKGLLGLMSPQSQQAFDEGLKRILCSNSTGQNSMLMLWCFGIAILAEYPDLSRAGYNMSSQPTPARKWRTESALKLFGTTSSHCKTLKLAYLNVIWAAKGNVGIPIAEATEGIKIATHILHFIDTKVRETWPTSSDYAKQLFPKLPSKIMQKDIHPSVQFGALCFYASMVGESKLSAEIVAEYTSVLPRVVRMLDTESFKEALTSSLSQYSVRILL